jgi:hypothetical protein
MKRVSFVLMMAVALATAPVAFAQQAQGSGSGSGSGQGQGRGQTVVATAPGTAVSMTNVRLDLTITDQTVGGEPIKKVISMLLAERGSGRVRSQGSVRMAGTNHSYGVQLNADAEMRRIEGERIRAIITVEYAPAPTAGAAEAQPGSALNQTVDVVLTNGKPTVIVQSADPLTDRKVTLEATATIIR